MSATKVEWWVVYYPRTPFFFWTEWLKQGFRHCDLWKPEYFGPEPENVVWLRLRPTFEMLECYLELDPTPPWVKHPGATVQKVQVFLKANKIREWFSIGPPSCVEICKAALGINAFFVRTPHQLHQYIRRRGGILK